jgi:hypothetical protein
MSKKILIEAMFSQFSSFFSELTRMYPDDPDFPAFTTNLRLMQMTNPMMVVRYVKSEIIDPFGDKIAIRDESFFLNQDFSYRGDVNLNIVDKLKQYISGMNSITKNVVWSYIQLITTLATKILETE